MNKIITCFIFVFVFFATSVFGQYESIQTETIFRSSIDNPVKIEVLENNGKYIFFATNRSFYPYELNFNFTELQNLSPAIYNRKFKIVNGNNRLFTLSVKDEKLNSFFNYEYNYSMGVPSKEIDPKYPYLIPLNSNSEIKLFPYNNISGTYVFDFFKLERGDTIYNMRKGEVLAIPDMQHISDRISKNNSLDILHSDGTIMVYENINPQNTYVEPGEIIYPNQPLGIINNTLCLEVYLIEVTKDKTLKKLTIHYYVDENKTEKFSDSFTTAKIVHPLNIITKEMGKREIKRYLKSRKS